MDKQGIQMLKIVHSCMVVYGQHYVSHAFTTNKKATYLIRTKQVHGRFVTRNINIPNLFSGGRNSSSHARYIR